MTERTIKILNDPYEFLSPENVNKKHGPFEKEI